ncbi:hypothetical protein EBP34_22645 [Salmonella enterica subsp. enterica serovar Saintpaul]|nr:hypothetical protein [Salmonella enterica subsp. enterica serovar Saintpaul]
MHKQIFARIVEPERLTIQDPEVLCQEETQFSSVYKTEALLCTKHICSEKSETRQYESVHFGVQQEESHRMLFRVSSESSSEGWQLQNRIQ